MSMFLAFPILLFVQLFLTAFTVKSFVFQFLFYKMMACVWVCPPPPKKNENIVFLKNWFSAFCQGSLF